MVMTRAQWEAMQKKLPAEDRVSYEDYLKSQGAFAPSPSTVAAEEGGTKAAISIGSQMSPEIVETIQNIPSPEAETDTTPKRYYNYFTGEWVTDPSLIKPREGMGGPESGGGTLEISEPTDVWRGSGTTSDPLTYNGTPFTGTRNGATYVNGVLKTDNNDNKGGITTGSGTDADPLIVNGKPFNGILGGVTYVNGVAQQRGPTPEQLAKEMEAKQRKSAQEEFRAALGELGLGDLADEVDRMIREDKTVSQIKLELPKTEAYKIRFPGMEALRKAGRAINEATYIANERGYLQTLRAYGLDTATLGSRSELGKYISNEVSPREFEERVNIAATRVKENPDVTAAFKSFYPEVDESGVIAYLLNPTKGMDIIRKQIRISEIGAASQVAGFAKDIMGVDQAAALISAVGEAGYGALRTEFQRARQLAISQRRLAQIEGQQYSDLEAIGAVVGDEVPKLLASERRAAREVARFGGGGGLTAGSLRETTAI